MNTIKRTLEGEVALVTGASEGIGAATARELAACGARVVIAARRPAMLEEQSAAIRAAGGEALAVPADIADPEQLKNLVGRAKEAYGRIDILVNNAGIGWWTPFVQTTPEEIVDIVQINLLGAMLLTRAVLPDMVDRRHGAIITLASVAGIVAVKPLYSATKYGVRGFCLSLRRQLTGTGVSVSVVSPGNIRTAMTNGVDEAMPGPELVAKTIADLVVHPRREVIVPRKHHAVVWLEQFLPGVADFAWRLRHRNDKRDWVKQPEDITHSSLSRETASR